MNSTLDGSSGSTTPASISARMLGVVALDIVLNEATSSALEIVSDGVQSPVAEMTTVKLEVPIARRAPRRPPRR